MQMEVQKHGVDIVKTFSRLASAYIFEGDYITLLDNAGELVEESDILLITVMDINGKIWISTNKNQERVIPMDLFYENIITQKKIGYRKIRHKGRSVMEFVSPISAFGKVMYLLTIEISLKTIENQAAGRIKEIILISMGLTFFAVLLGILISRLVTEPLNELVKGTNEISLGNLDYKIAVTSSDEIGKLSESFNQMTHNLQKLLSEQKKAETKIQRTRDELEMRVEKRTAELQKEIEERILAEEKYRKLMEASPVAIAVYDMKGYTVYINPAFTFTFGWTLEELQGKKIDFIPEESLPQTFKMIKRLKQGERCHGFETRRYNKNKDILDVSISFDVWRGQDGMPKGSVVILHDITQRKQLEMQLYQSRKMEAIGTLAGGIAHDFNNILSGIFSFSQLALRHIDNPERARKDIGYISQGSQRAADLIQQILTFSRKTEYQKQTIELYDVVKEALKLLRSSIPATIEIQDNVDSKARVLADPTQMHQVIMNLCTNAYHAMRKKGGVLIVELNEVEVSEQEMQADVNLLPGAYLKLVVSDTGCGMENNILEKVFDPYFTTKETGKGTGFGLALVQAIVEEHDGYVKAFSIPEMGSSFSVYLPILEQTIDTYSAVPDVWSLVGGTETIMVVDDEEAIRESIRELLEDCGYTAASFENGVKAFQEFEKDPDRFDLIITDMTMPRMAGDELAIKILNVRKGMPIILCTGYSENITEAKTIEIGIRRYFQKPISNEHLTLLIREVLDEK